MFKLIHLSGKAMFLEEVDNKTVVREFIVNSNFDQPIGYESILKERIFFPLVFLN